jgi:prepilin-type N-terminal cleavage/methylation domain-containing protein
MHASPVHSRTGLTLLEVMVALVILGLVGTAFLETFTGALWSTARARAWAQALVYADEGQEATKLQGLQPAVTSDIPLGGGFRRRITSKPWGLGVTRVTVTVTLPDGQEFDLDRLVPAP